MAYRLYRLTVPRFLFNEFNFGGPEPSGSIQLNVSSLGMPLVHKVQGWHIDSSDDASGYTFFVLIRRVRSSKFFIV